MAIKLSWYRDYGFARPVARGLQCRGGRRALMTLKARGQVAGLDSSSRPASYRRQSAHSVLTGRRR